jgi:cytoskeletal protein RodZ
MAVANYTLGDILKKQRELLGKTIADMSLLSGIEAKYIEYLEVGNYDRLPSDIYIKNFLKQYIVYLNLDWEKVNELYSAEYFIYKRQKKKNKFNFFSLKKIRKLTLTPQFFKIMSLVVLIFLLLFYIFNKLNKFMNYQN